MLTKATVIGTGAMGTICAQVLASNGIHVAMLGRREEHVRELQFHGENRAYLPGMKLSLRIRPTLDAAAALHGTELIVSAVPTQHLRATWARLGPSVPPEAPICSATKGLEVASFRRPSEIIAEFAPSASLVALSGPSIAPELARCLPATVVVASRHPHAAELVQSAMSTSWFRIYTSADVIGVELGGAVKNVVALAAGILDGLHAGDNAKAALVTRGLVEITRLGTALGARPETFVGLAGVGDLVTTCVSPLGRNRSAGERIGQGADAETVQRETSSVIEGIPTTRAVLELARRMRIDMPITEAVYEVLFERKPPLVAITELMTRPPKSETTAGGDA